MKKNVPKMFQNNIKKCNDKIQEYAISFGLSVELLLVVGAIEQKCYNKRKEMLPFTYINVKA